MTPREPLADLNGDVMPLSQVRISALDRGFLFGDAVYEVLRVYSGKPWLEDDHFARLSRSLNEIRLTGIDVSRLRRRMHELLRRGTIGEGMVYIHITRGSAPRRHAFPADAVPLELMWVQDFDDPYVAKRQKGIAVVTQPDLRWKRCDIKTTNLLGNVLAMQAAVEAGCIEALLVHPDGAVVEGTHTNLFGVVGGTLVTAPTTNTILPGCTRGLVIDLARKIGVAVEEQYLHRNRLNDVDEMFLSGTTSEILPIVSVDDRVIGQGVPGPIARRLQQAYAESVLRFIAGRSEE